MPDALWLALALGFSGIGMGWLALAMGVHWKQVREASPRSRRSVMLLAVSAAGIAFVLSSRPKMLAPLIAFSGR